MTRTLSPRYRCPRCIEQGWPPHLGSEPQCAFDERGRFVSDNWNCATMAVLRSWLYDDFRSFDTGMHIVCSNDEDCQGFIVLGFYKSRGRTGTALFVQDDRTQRLTLAVAERVIASLRK